MLSAKRGLRPEKDLEYKHVDKQLENSVPFISSWYLLISTDCIVSKEVGDDIASYFGFVQN